ncbi:L-aspartate oxidase [Planococcus salinarum]|uniref:L-aspartate oxidase n=1 Tax=Planococcus salinarum TaxID=622695 RepID=UPI000E3E673E|nr:L-aspartate oxidase [Planococcus salinarum]TAA72720.1 L-aspartate oxidase [Planococcus salinarum]
MFDVCIIGGGVAGLMLAHSLPPHFKIAVLTKGAPANANSTLAQGGIAASLDFLDSPEAHAQDTLQATAGHSAPERVEILTREGASAIRELMADGLPYDKDDAGQPLLGMEGAHSIRRILHSSGDQTGKILMAYLMKKTENRIQLFSHHQALELLVKKGECLGVIAADKNGQRHVFKARHTVLATGGVGGLYSNTSNSPVAEGEGLSLAYRAGAILEDLEFVQFHPTILTIGGKSKGLISEAVRGEGALLVDKEGRSIMEGIHPWKELAPRDIVARAIESHWQLQGPVFLDARHISDFGDKFPAILKNCLAQELNPVTELLPVRPGAHFHMGGVKTDDKGGTNVQRLYAIGEVASTGVHGANRLASNSLLESIVFAKRLAGKLSETFIAGSDDVHIKDWNVAALPPPFLLPPHHLLGTNMTKSVGIVRDKKELAEFIRKFPLQSVDDLLTLNNKEISSFHRSTACTLLATAAYLRDESRGAHFRRDRPSLSAHWQGKVIELSVDGIAFTDRKIHSKETV